jgi:DNA repair protein RadC
MAKVKTAALLREIHITYKVKKVKSPVVGQKVTGPEIVVKLFRDLQNETKEKLVLINLDAAQKILCFEVVAIGSSNACRSRPIEVFTSSFLTRATSAIVVHNHPSGEAKPSKDDLTFTKKLLKVARLIELVLLDHIIIGYEDYYSFAENGKIPRRF